MKFRTFQNNYHDGHLTGFRLGPRRELTLELALDPVWNKGAPSSAWIRLGGIVNYDEVALYFRGLPTPPKANAYIAEIVGVGYMGEGPNWVVVDLVHHGHIKIHSRHVTES